MANSLPSTLRLLAALGDEKYDEHPDPFGDQSAILGALTSWENALYKRISVKEYNCGVWPCTADMLEALRAALVDQKGNCAGDELAYVLVRCGCDRKETLGGLCAWDAQLFNWAAAGFSAVDLLENFQDAGIGGRPDEKKLSKFNRWLAAPATALSEYSSSSLVSTFLKGRVYRGNLDSRSCDDCYSELFLGLATHAFPPLDVSEVSETVNIDSSWILHYTWRENRYALSLDEPSRPVEDKEITQAINQLLERDGRRTRVFRFAGGRRESVFDPLYVIAESDTFIDLCRKLGVPLCDFSKM